MTEIIKTPTFDVLSKNIINSKKQIILCSPYIKKEIIKQILPLINNNVNVSIITCLNIASFIKKSSDIEALELLLDNNINIYNFQNLHAKVYLFDLSTAIITSANLTYNGLKNNYEYGVLISDNNLINDVNNDMHSIIKNNLTGKLNKVILNSIKDQVISHKYNESDVIIDEIGDEILTIDYNSMLNSFSKSTWKYDIFKIICKLDTNFTLKMLYLYEEELKEKHTKNSKVKDKIRQVLQDFRDMGLIKFIKPGVYKKYYKLKMEN